MKCHPRVKVTGGEKGEKSLRVKVTGCRLFFLFKVLKFRFSWEFLGVPGTGVPREFPGVHPGLPRISRDFPGFPGISMLTMRLRLIDLLVGGVPVRVKSHPG